MLIRPYVCVRCQLHLSRRLAWRLPSSFSQRALHSTATPLSNDPFHNDDDEELPPEALAYLRRLDKPESVAREYRLWGNERVKAQNATLRSSRLGRTAKVILLSESLAEPHYEGETRELEAKDSLGIDILAQLDRERGTLTWADIEAGIEESRPGVGQGPETLWEFDDLARSLQDGFTTHQMIAYIASHKARQKLQDTAQKTAQTAQKATTSKRNTGPRIRVSQWMPGTSDIRKFIESPLRGYAKESHSYARAIAIRILRECWQVEVAELAQGIGEVEVSITSQNLATLLYGDQSTFASISSSYIAGGEENLQIYRPRNVIRITSTREKSTFIVRAIEEAIESVKRIKLRMEHLMPPSDKPGSVDQQQKWFLSQFGEKVLSKVSRLTETEIKASQGTVTIACVNPNPNSVTSKRFEDARRLLLTSVNPVSPGSHTIECRVTDEERGGGFITCEQTKALSWRERLHGWSRWNASIGKESELEEQAGSQTKATESSESSEASLQRPTKDPAKRVPKAIRNSSATKWSWEKEPSFLDTSATVGSILHTHLDARPLEMGMLESNSKSPVIHTFSANAPNLTGILQKCHLARAQSRESLAMQFLPNPWSTLATSKGRDYKYLGSRGISLLPPIEMRFMEDQMTDQHQLQLVSVKALKSVDTSDLMLPECGVDLRFQKRTYHYLLGALTGSNAMPSIVEFVKHCELDLTSGPLKTPAKIKIPLAPYLCKANAFELLGGGGEELMTIEYLFTGLEYRHVMVLDYEGMVLIYSSIDAGKAGGQRRELRLKAMRHDNRPVSEKEFLDASYRLAEALSQRSEMDQSEDRKITTDSKGLVKSISGDVEGERVFHL